MIFLTQRPISEIFYQNKFRNFLPGYQGFFYPLSILKTFDFFIFNPEKNFRIFILGLFFPRKQF